MRIRNARRTEAQSSRFNTHGIGEIVVWYDSGEADSDYMTNWEVFIKATQQWMSFKEAFDSNHLITDNYNTCFFEPTNEEDRQRGYTL